MLIKVTVTGAKEVAAGFVSIAELVKDLRPFWRDEFAPQFFADVQDRFTLQGQGRNRSGRFVGGRWAPLSPAYKAWKDRFFPGKKILERTGRLRASMTWSGGAVGPEGLFEPTRTNVVAGTRVPYGPYHQHGTDRMPARPFLDEPDEAEWSVRLAQWVAREAQKKGLLVKVK